MKHYSDQFEIPFVNEPFQLAQQSALDGDDLAKLAQQRKQDRAAAEAKQAALPENQNPKH